MHSNTNSDYEKRKYGDNTAPGGGRIRASDVDPRRVDDFRERIRRKEEERKRNQSDGQGSSRSYSHS
ncbi:hypothetical protein [Candidatus Wolbachia massiliensis]|uniref:Uncharacterized protein n=1 Tax=Candidatus Wolbachia massiliensis TaxID=1845000 RepID=A0A7L7YMR3_9RICK|nr:hypothetical protein [Candidatus Wolbachia massiliensis]QOD38348.1 hypothetical protein ID128_00190 [Candidatus Wolbachia massiliensis]